MKSSHFLFPLIISVFTALGVILGYWISPGANNTQSNSYKTKLTKLDDVLELINNKYVDSVDVERIFEKTISTLLHQLDPHSNYISAKDLISVNESIDGDFGGVGMRFFILRDTICITQIIPNSPCMASGVKAGDKIIFINKEKVAGTGVDNQKVMSLLKGKSGTDVEIKVLRGKKQKHFFITRGTIPIETVVAQYMDGDIGYIKLDQFSIKSAEEFRSAAQSLKKQGMKKMILDLRNNGGGVLGSAVQIIDAFLEKGKLIVKTKGVNKEESEYLSSGSESLLNLPLVVLINENSASASEIVSGAIQDNDRGTIIGRRSFGKGLVQEDSKLRDGSVIRLTVARYYTPTGRCIQRSYENGYDEYRRDDKRWERGELYKIDSSLFVDSLKFKTPKGKTVYGGGGIMPDVFVPYDSLKTNLQLVRYSNLGCIQAFAFDFVSNKRNKWRSINSFKNNFFISDQDLKSFIKYSIKYYDINYNEAEFKKIKTYLASMIKAEIARQLWIEQGFYQIYNLNDKVYKKAKQALK